MQENSEQASFTSSSNPKKKKRKTNIANKESKPSDLKAGAFAGSSAKKSCYAYEMVGHAQQTVDRYLELAKKTKDSSKKVATPCIDDHLIPPEEFEVKGELSAIAGRDVLEALYVVRISRLDFMWSVNMLAREVTCWTAACDRRLHRRIAFMHHTQDWAQICYVSDSPSQCWLALFYDASFAGDLRDSKSTSGGLLCFVGPITYVPVSWLCENQTAVSHSTSEAEVISFDAGARLEGLPALILWDLVIDVFEPTSKPKSPSALTSAERDLLHKTNCDMFGAID